MLKESISYFLPYSSFEWFFFLVISSIAIVTMILIKKSAQDHSWQKKWFGLDKTNLQSQHGSIHDLSQKVATGPENFGDILPSTLLILGLLGTFVGLGLALNKASLIISQGSSSDMEGAMGDLMLMMQGLGTKFKTSSWGILGYLTFKTWTSINNYHGRRLDFCAKMLSGELNNYRTYRIKLFNIHQENLEVQKNLLKYQSSMNETLNKLHEKQTTDLHTQSLRFSKIHDLLKALEASLSGIGSAATKIENSADSFGHTAEQLGTTVELLSSSVTTTFESLQNNFKILMDDTTTSLVAAVEKITTATNDMKISLDTSLNNVQTGIEGILNQSSQQLLESSTELKTILGEMNVKLSQTMNDMNDSVTNMKDGVGEVLSKTSEAMQLQIGSLDDKMTKTLENLKSNLDQMVEGLFVMTDSFTKEMTQTLQQVEQVLEGSAAAQNESVLGFQASTNHMKDDLGSALASLRDTVKKFANTLDQTNGLKAELITLQKESNEKLLKAVKSVQQTAPGPLPQKKALSSQTGLNTKANQKSISPLKPSSLTSDLATNASMIEPKFGNKSPFKNTLQVTNKNDDSPALSAGKLKQKSDPVKSDDFDSVEDKTEIVSLDQTNLSLLAPQSLNGDRTQSETESLSDNNQQSGVDEIRPVEINAKQENTNTEVTSNIDLKAEEGLDHSQTEDEDEANS
jgi:hypothetical protein